MENYDHWLNYSIPLAGKCDIPKWDYVERYDSDSEDSSAWLETAFHMVGLNRQAHALECFERAIEKDPENIKTWLKTGDYLNQLGDEDCQEFYDMAYDLDLEGLNVLENTLS